ncbi:Putative transport protein [Paraburkholderia ultramafica]|uniref:Transport protein n=1 Tax=Paraburkholderia ultramafica TaxID=1544867 RepID=A0A6S7B8E7_9BURK|nr:AI-2E family transporter [Paraburkholderia ultramafica]CAB3791253.1 Putative transport protein [Paraburkholderia ultramafica]
MNVYHRQSLLWGAVVLSVGVLLWYLRPVLTPFLLGAIIAYVLQPGVEWLVRHRTPRGLAALIMISLFTSLIALLGLLIFAVVQKEGPELTKQIPLMMATLDAKLKPWLAFMGLSYSLDLASIRDALAAHLKAGEQGVALAMWQYLRTSGNVMLNIVSNVVLVPLVLFYLLYDRHEAFVRMESFVPRRWLGWTREFVRETDRLMSQYLRGQLLVIAVLAAFYPIALMMAGLDMALPVGILTALAVFIPYIGFASGLAFALLAALLQFGNWYGFGAVILVYGIGQILESFVLTPRLVGERIGLHPLAVIFALLAFGRLFGFFGVLLALPASAILASALRELRRRYLASTLYRN